MSAEQMGALDAMDGMGGMDALTAVNGEPSTLQVYLVLDAVDMRMGVEGLSMLVERSLGGTPCAGSAYAFSNKTRSRMKLLRWDATGVWLATRRLHEGRFVWPRVEVSKAISTSISTSTTISATISATTTNQQAVVLEYATWQWLVSGVDWQRLTAKVSDNARWRVS